MLALWLLLFADPLGNVAINFNPGPVVFTDHSGAFWAVVATPYSGTITPSYPGCVFTPASVTVSGVTMDQNVGQFACMDISPPAVSITNPTNGSTLPRAPITLRCVATDNISVVSVTWAVDDVAVGAVVTAPFSLVWGPPKGGGWHTITATARDEAGNTTKSAGIRVRFR